MAFTFEWTSTRNQPTADTVAPRICENQKSIVRMCRAEGKENKSKNHFHKIGENKKENPKQQQKSYDRYFLEKSFLSPIFGFLRKWKRKKEKLNDASSIEDNLYAFVLAIPGHWYFSSVIVLHWHCCCISVVQMSSVCVCNKWHK